MSEIETSFEYEGPPATFSERPWPRPWMGKFLDALAIMPSVTGAARAAGISRQHSYVARDQWPDFAEGWREAHEVGVELLEQNTIRWATVGLEMKEITTRKDGAGNLIETTERVSRHLSPTLAMFILKRFRPEYRDSSTVQVQGAVPVRLEVDRVPTRERMLELAQLAQQFGLPAGVAPVIDMDRNGHVDTDT